MLKKIYKFHILPYINPFINFQISGFEGVSGINSEINREFPIIVSLTSYRGRFKDLPKTLYSLLSQTLKPDKIILWLNKDSEELAYLPYEISQFIKNGLEIRFVEDIKSYTKIIYALEEFKNYIIVTADDDIFYPKDWLEKLYYSFIAHPKDIQVHRAHKVKITNGKIEPYESWDKQINEESASYNNFLTGAGGVLYPPNCFSGEVFRRDIFLKYAPDADDIWLWIMALTNNRKIRVVRNHNRTLLITNLFLHFGKNNLYSRNKTGGNDSQLNNLMKFYKQNVMNKLI